jgi:hypothetical protein
MVRRTNRRNYGTGYTYGNDLHVTRVRVPLTAASGDSATTDFSWWDERALAWNSPGGTLSAADTAVSYTRIDGPRSGVADSARFWVDRWGAPVRVIGPADTTIVTRSSTTGLVTMARDAAGDSVTAFYNARGNLDSLKDHKHEGGGSTVVVATSYVYGDTSAPDSPTQVRSPVDTTTIQYHATLGLPSLVTRQGGGRTGFTYDATYGLLLSVTDYGARVVDTTTWTRGSANESCSSSIPPDTAQTTTMTS